MSNLKGTPDLPLYSLQEELAFCRSDLEIFIEKCFKVVSPGTPFLPNWHLGAYAEYLTACLKRDIKRLIINVPPRYLKSISGSVAFPAFALGHDPALKFLCASYSKALSFKHSMDCRYFMESEWYKMAFPATQLTEDQNEKGKFYTTARGMRQATSVGGVTTGEGCNFLIIDDPHNAMHAQSDTIRQSQINWFDQAATSRLNDKKNDVIIIIMQRLHPEDLTHHLLTKDEYELLLLPAEAKRRHVIKLDDHILKVMEKGDILHPEREGPEELRKMKRSMGTASYNAQYLQDPEAGDSGIIHRSWFKLWPADKALPEFEYFVQSWDTAFTEKTENDPSAMSAWGVFKPTPDAPYHVMLCDTYNDNIEYPTLRKKAAELYQFRYGENDKTVDLVLIEEKGSGITLKADLHRAQVPVRGYNPGRADKIARAHAVSHLVEAGLVYIPESINRPGEPVSWAEDFLKQVCKFPSTTHDDYVDTFTQFMALVRDQEFLTIDPTYDPLDEKEPERPRDNPYMH